MPTYNIIGDIHGRDAWKRLVDESCINIFVGDYFDPYDNIHFMDLQFNFMEIIEYKKKHPENVVLLYGNHDYEYLPGIFEKSNRFDNKNAQTISWLLMKTIALKMSCRRLYHRFISKGDWKVFLNCSEVMGYIFCLSQRRKVRKVHYEC